MKTRYSRRTAIAAATGGLALLITPHWLVAQTSPAERRSRDMDIEIKRNGSRPSTKGSPDWFTGSVRVDPLFQAPDPARVGAGHVTFEPGLAPTGTRIRSDRH